MITWVSILALVWINTALYWWFRFVCEKTWAKFWQIKANYYENMLNIVCDVLNATEEERTVLHGKYSDRSNGDGFPPS